MIKPRIVLSTLALFLLTAVVACVTDPAPPIDRGPPVAAVSDAVLVAIPAPCGIWFGATFEAADGRSEIAPWTPDAQFYTNSFATCADAVHACIDTHAREPWRFCQVRQPGSTSAGLMIVCGIGTSPNCPGGAYDDTSAP